MSAERHVALLRGINVGGKNIIKMADLRERFEVIGLLDVTTYIQSGNVIFATEQACAAPDLVARIEPALGAAFGYESRVAVVPADVLRDVVEQAPAGFGSEPDVYRYDVLFPLPPVTSTEVLGELRLREGVDTAEVGEHAVYFRRLIARATESQLSRLVQLPIYQSVTIRNWNTTTKLLGLVSGSR